MPKKTFVIKTVFILLASLLILPQLGHTQILPGRSDAPKPDNQPVREEQGETYTLTLKNNFSHEVSAAVGYFSISDDDWISEGWFNIPSGGSATATFRGVRPETVGVYAESGQNRWEGQTNNNAIPIDPVKKFKFHISQTRTGINGIKAVQMNNIGWESKYNQFTFTFM